MEEEEGEEGGTGEERAIVQKGGNREEKRGKGAEH